KIINIDGEEWLLYKRFPIDVALIRGTVADENGNLTVDKEMGILEALPLAMAAKNSGGIVIAQAEYIAQRNTLHPKDVRVPGVLVDYVVIGRPENHLQTQVTYFNPGLSGDIRVPVDRIPPLPLDAKKIIGRRAALELRPGAVVNLGVGIPAAVASVAAEEGVSDQFTLTTELGVFGGVPAYGLDFGASYNSEAMIEHSSMFDFYDGGGLDVTFVGLAQVDRHGNVNVSKFASAIPGCGGFIDITHKTRRIVFCGTFTAGGLEVAVDTSGVKVVKEGAIRKIVGDVEQVTLNGELAAAKGQEILYVTERCVFKLTQEGPVLVEIAPGIDLERDIISLVEFPIPVSEDLRTMDARIFQPGRMELSKSF
ncbi:MAG: acyl CoA:acetate/3-ketoacid CoA transferase, partial [Firmicutes bacterium]|nr:acyl CoA:acetate/3-ketoacid CoA transferase [Bacillota bacterium]